MSVSIMYMDFSSCIYIKWSVFQNTITYIHVTLSHLRSKEITGIHKPCIPHSNDSSATTEYKPVCIQM